MTKTVHAIPCCCGNREVKVRPSPRFIYVSFLQQKETKYRIEIMVSGFPLPLSFSEKWYLYLCVQENSESTPKFRDKTKRNSLVLPFEPLRTIAFLISWFRKQTFACIPLSIQLIVSFYAWRLTATSHWKRFLYNHRS